jgi:AICAR transformylase/IMP cyclohydrolase PurH
MFAIVFKEDRIPMCARLKETGPDAIVTWDSDSKAKAFLEAKGTDFVSAYDIVAIGDDSLKDMAGAMGIKEEEIELIPFPS